LWSKGISNEDIKLRLESDQNRFYLYDKTIKGKRVVGIISLRKEKGWTFDHKVESEFAKSELSVKSFYVTYEENHLVSKNVWGGVVSIDNSTNLMVKTANNDVKKHKPLLLNDEENHMTYYLVDVGSDNGDVIIVGDDSTGVTTGE
jgi:hypothetical protein